MKGRNSLRSVLSTALWVFLFSLGGLCGSAIPLMGRTTEPTPAPPVFSGDPEAALRLEEPLRAAMTATAGYGPWPEGRWEIRLHPEAVGFERATRAAPQRGAQWVGEVLHLRPWEQLRRRDLGAILRHELVHRRLAKATLRRWVEEARCLHAESHVRPPARWPAAPDPAQQDRLDRALAGGTTREQAWAYRALRAWLSARPVPAPPARPAKAPDPWRKEALRLEERIFVEWPSERLPEDLEINGQRLSELRGNLFRYTGEVRFGGGAPLGVLQGSVSLSRVSRGWTLVWTTTPEAWVAAATAGELGEDAPYEARRALAAVLKRWLAGHPRGNHPDGSLCPLTHCAVVRGEGSEDTKRAVGNAPELALDARWAFFCGSKGGVSLSTREVWGEGPADAQPAEAVPEDRWGTWARSLTPAQVRLLKASVRPGLKTGQRGLLLGKSGPYAIEALRLAAGRAFGWTIWPSNACEAVSKTDGTLELWGHGWGHNVGLCLATACWQARQGGKAEAILAGAFGPGVVRERLP